MNRSFLTHESSKHGGTLPSTTSYAHPHYNVQGKFPLHGLKSRPIHFSRHSLAIKNESNSSDAPFSSSSPSGGSGVAAFEDLEDRVGVLLLNLGGPETLEDVQPFLFNLFADPDIIRLPKGAQFLQPIIAQIVSTLRSPKSREGYEAIGGGSPLRKITEEQACALAEALQRKGLPARAYVAMRYWKPFTGTSYLMLYFVVAFVLYFVVVFVLLLFL